MVAGAQVEQVVRGGREGAVQRGRLQQPLQHAAGAAVLQALVRRQRVLGPVPPVAELAHVQRVRLLVFVLEVSLQGIVTRECPAAVGTLLGLVDPAGGGRRHAEGRDSCNTKTHPVLPAAQAHYLRTQTNAILRMYEVNNNYNTNNMHCTH